MHSMWHVKVAPICAPFTSPRKDAIIHQRPAQSKKLPAAAVNVGFHLFHIVTPPRCQLWAIKLKHECQVIVGWVNVPSSDRRSHTRGADCEGIDPREAQWRPTPPGPQVGDVLLVANMLPVTVPPQRRFFFVCLFVVFSPLNLINRTTASGKAKEFEM